MKYLLVILFIIFSIHIVIAQNSFQRISVNFALSHPILGKNDFPDYRHYLDREIEVLLNFKKGKSNTLSTGIGFESAEHFRIEEINELIWSESLGNYFPHEITNNWRLKHKSVLLPLIIEGSMNNSFLDYFIVSNKIGWIFKYELSEHKMPDVSKVKINKTFWELSFGVGKKLLQFKNISFDISPLLGSRFYLTNNNAWQNNYLFYQIKFNVNF